MVWLAGGFEAWRFGGFGAGGFEVSEVSLGSVRFDLFEFSWWGSDLIPLFSSTSSADSRSDSVFLLSNSST